MKKIDGTPFVKLIGMECDREKKSFIYLKTPIKGLYYVPADIERKGRKIIPERFVPALLEAIKKTRGAKMHFGVLTSARNFGLSWRPISVLEVFNNFKTFDVDFSSFAEKYRKLGSYYSKTLAAFYGSFSLKKIFFRKVRLVPEKNLTYDDAYIRGFYISKEKIAENANRYKPKNANGRSMLKKEYETLISDLKRI